MHLHLNKNTLGKNLIVAILLNSVIVVAELIGGILSNSLALLSDALHNAGDLIALLGSLIALKISKKKSHPGKTFGYVRAEIIAAFLNSTLLFCLGIFIIYEGISRFVNPEPVEGFTIIIVAAISFFANAFSSFILHKNSMNDLNAKSAYLHLIYDAIHSLAVVIVGLLIYFFGWTIADSISSIVIGIFIIKSAWGIIHESTNILSEGTPTEISHKEVEEEILNVEGVLEIHHLHIWKLASQFVALTVHVVVEDQAISKGFLIINRIEKMLMEKFKINHPTIQLEAKIETKFTNVKL